MHAPWVSLRSSGIIGFTPACPTCRWFQPVSLDLLAHALCVVRFIRDRWVNSRRHGVLWVNRGRSRALRVFSFIWGRWVRLRIPGVRCDHPGSLDSLALGLRVDGFILDVDGFLRGRWVHSCAHWGSMS